jgi:hypothetical protein
MNCASVLRNVRMPDKVQTIWADLDKKGKIRRISTTVFTGLKKLKVHYHSANKRGMGRSKGNSHERETARILSKWFFGKAHPKAMKRTPLSGGWSGGKMGDVCLDPEYARRNGFKDPRIYVECRNYKDVLQYNLMSWAVWETPKIYSDWIKEVEQKCDGRLPMLVMKGKGTDAWVMVLYRWIIGGSSGVFSYCFEQIIKAKPISFESKKFGFVYLLPLKRIKRLGDGREFLREWVRDGGPAQLRGLVESPTEDRKQRG